MHILVTYFSQGGNTRISAEAIVEAAQGQPNEVSIKPIGKLTQVDVNDADVIFIGTWVQGYILFGVKPARAELWVPNLPSIEGKPVGVFCTYAFHPRGSLHKLSDMLAGRGANPVAQHAFHRSNLQQGAEAFVQQTLEAARRR